MFYNRDVKQMRACYFDVWEKYLQSAPMEDFEEQILKVILEHPEYHKLLSERELHIDKEYHPDRDETNPFLHMALHLAIRDQALMDAPEGIKKIYHSYCHRFQGEHLLAEHSMIEILLDCLWQSKKHDKKFDSYEYLKKLDKQLIKSYSEAANHGWSHNL